MENGGGVSGPSGQRCCDGCGKPPEPGRSLKSCSVCHAAWYHNVQCQRKNYKAHRRTCSRPRPSLSQNTKPIAVPRSPASVQVERREGRGRCLIASNHLPSQTRIGDFPPLVPPVLFRNQQHQRCAVCFRKVTKPVQSRHFRNAQFTVTLCNNLCKEEFHRQSLDKEMVCISRLPGQCELLPTALLLFRIVIRSEDKPELGTELENLQHHSKASSDVSPDEAIHTAAITYLVQSLLNAYKHHQPHHQNPAIRTDAIIGFTVERLLSAFKTNCFTISQGFLAQEDGIGVGLFASPASAINHSCIPNATQTFAYGEKGKLPTLWVTAMSAIEVGEELCISYLDARMKTSKRKGDLFRNYHFVCSCRRCKDPNLSDFPDGDYQQGFEQAEELVDQLLQHDNDVDTNLRNAQAWLGSRDLATQYPSRPHDILHHLEMKCRVAHLRGVITAYRSTNGNPLQSIHELQQTRTALMAYFPPSHEALVAVEDLLRMFCP